MISGSKKYDERSKLDIRYKDLHIGNGNCYLLIKLDKDLTFEKQLNASILKVNV